MWITIVIVLAVLLLIFFCSKSHEPYTPITATYRLSKDAVLRSTYLRGSNPTYYPDPYTTIVNWLMTVPYPCPFSTKSSTGGGGIFLTVSTDPNYVSSLFGSGTPDTLNFLYDNDTAYYMLSSNNFAYNSDQYPDKSNPSILGNSSNMMRNLQVVFSEFGGGVVWGLSGNEFPPPASACSNGPTPVPLIYIVNGQPSWYSWTGDGTWDLSWSKPVNTGGDPTCCSYPFTITDSSSGTQVIATTAPSNSYSFTNFDWGITYSIVMYAENTSGESASPTTSSLFSSTGPLTFYSSSLPLSSGSNVTPIQLELSVIGAGGTPIDQVQDIEDPSKYTLTISGVVGGQPLNSSNVYCIESVAVSQNFMTVTLSSSSLTGVFGINDFVTVNLYYSGTYGISCLPTTTASIA